MLLPVRDARPFLRSSLASLARQTLAEHEIVAVDDGSTDGSSEFLESWREREPRLRVVRQGALGLVAALNRGLAECRAPVVARMDADDLSDRRRLELQLESLEGSGRPDVVSCRVTHFPPSSVGAGFRLYEAWLNGLCSHEAIVRERFVESPLPHPSVMVRRAALEEAGGYRDRGWPEDYDLWLRLAQAGRRFHKRPETLLLWRHHGRRLTLRDGRYSVERFLECKAHHLVRGPLAAGRPFVVWGAGPTGRRLVKHLQRRGAEPRAFVDIDPAKVGRTRRRVPIVSVDQLWGILADEPKTRVLSAVASRGGREAVRSALAGRGLVEGDRFWCVA